MCVLGVYLVKTLKIKLYVTEQLMIMSQHFLCQKMRAVTLNIGPILLRKSYL